MRRLVLVPLWVIACFSEPPIADTCHVGAKGCDCHPDQTCDGALVCEPSIHKCIAADCVAGAELCPCGPSDGCFGGLVCTDGLCQPRGQDTVADGTAATNASEPTSASNGTSGSVDSTLSSVGETVPMTSDATIPATEGSMSDSGAGSSGDTGVFDCPACIRATKLDACTTQWTNCSGNCVALDECILDGGMPATDCCPMQVGEAQAEWNTFLACADITCFEVSMDCMPSALFGCP